MPAWTLLSPALCAQAPTASALAWQPGPSPAAPAPSGCSPRPGRGKGPAEHPCLQGHPFPMAARRETGCAEPAARERDLGACWPEMEGRPGKGGDLSPSDLQSPARSREETLRNRAERRWGRGGGRGWREEDGEERGEGECGGSETKRGAGEGGGRRRRRGGKKDGEEDEEEEEGAAGQAAAGAHSPAPGPPGLAATPSPRETPGGSGLTIARAAAVRGRAVVVILLLLLPGGGGGGGLPRLTTPCPRQGKQPEARHPHTDTPASSQGLEQVPLSRSNFPNRQRAPPSPLSTHPGPRCEPGPKRTPARGLGDRQRKARALGRPEASSSFPEGAREQCRCLGRSANVILGGVEEAEIKSLLLRVSAQTGKLGVPLLRAGERSWRRLGSREGLPIWSWILFSSLVWGTVAISTYTGCLFQSS